jgi:nicotinamidase-related amidase
MSTSFVTIGSTPDERRGMPIRGLDAPESAALVISECQNGMTNPEYATNKPLAEQVTSRGMIPAIAKLADGLRQLGVPIVHMTVAAYPGHRGWTANSVLTGVFRKRPLTVGSPAVAINPGLTPHPDDFVITRHRGLTSFHGTELEYLLRNMGVKTVIMAGVSTNIAVSGSCLEAVNRGFQVVVPEDCTSGATAETHAFMIENIIPLLATVTASATILDQLMNVSGVAR